MLFKPLQCFLAENITKLAKKQMTDIECQAYTAENFGWKKPSESTTASDVLRHQVNILVVDNIENCFNSQCDTSSDLIGCIERGTYSREEALVHASVGFDTRWRC